MANYNVIVKMTSTLKVNELTHRTIERDPGGGGRARAGTGVSVMMLLQSGEEWKIDDPGAGPGTEVDIDMSNVELYIPSEHNEGCMMCCTIVKLKAKYKYRVIQ